MSIKAALRSILTGNETLAALVAGRIYPAAAPSGAAYPYITFQKISASNEHHQGGATGLAQVRMQINCWALSSVTAESVADAVRGALDGYSGTAATETIKVAYFDGAVDDYEPPDEQNQRGVYSEKIDYLIWHTESVPSFE